MSGIHREIKSDCRTCVASTDPRWRTTIPAVHNLLTTNRTGA